MPTGGRTLSQAAQAFGRGARLFSPRTQVSLPRPYCWSLGLPIASPSHWYRLLLRLVSLRSAGRNWGGGFGDFHFSLLVNAWLRQACTAAEDMAEQRYCVDYAKRGTAGCKKCKEKIVKGMVRIGKIVPNPFTESGGDMKEWYHVKCIFEKLEKARATTKKIEDITDLEGWEELQDGEKELINKHISGEMQGTTWITFLCYSLSGYATDCPTAFMMKSSLMWVVVLKSVSQPYRRGKK